MRRRAPSLAAVAALALASCGGHAPKGPNSALFLTLVRSPLAGQSAAASDAEMVKEGQRACADLDAGERPDAVVADLAGQPEPGSPAFNAASFVMAAAVNVFCPQHKRELSGSPNAFDGSP